MKKLALVFAGQGSQFVDMGLDFIDVNPSLITMMTKADEMLGYQTKEVIQSEDGRMNQTRFTQPLVFLSTLFAYETFKTLNAKPEAVLGFSLGEYAAFYAAGLFSFDQLLDIVKVRATLMDEQSKKNPGQMAAILGLSSHDIDMMCRELGDGIYPANYNSPVQTVISGYENKIDLAILKAKECGAKRAIKLNVSGAFHSPLMKDAAYLFKDYIDPINVSKAMYPVYLNTTGKALIENQLKSEMVKQIFSPVRFVDAIKNMKDQGFTHFLEIGPGTVLSGLIKKIDTDLDVFHLEKASDLDEVKGWLENHGFIE